MESLQFQSIDKIEMVTQSIPGLVGLISPRLDRLVTHTLVVRIMDKHLEAREVDSRA